MLISIIRERINITIKAFNLFGVPMKKSPEIVTQDFHFR